MDNSVFLLKAISDVFTAGGAITAFSLLIYVITFQIKDIVTRSYTFLLASIVVILATDAFFTTTSNPGELAFLLRLQFVGLIVLPAAYFYFSNALLAITGNPSRGKRTIFGGVSILISAFFLYLNFAGKLFLEVAITNSPVPSIQRTIFFDFFSVYFVIVMSAAWYNFFRAVKRTSSKKSQRRMLYLVIAAFGPALGSFPYLLYGSEIIVIFPSLFWLVSIIAYLVISTAIIIMTYTVSFFGLPWPDRVIKSRLFKWIMRGPATAILTLGVTTLISRLAVQFGVDLQSINVLGMVAAIIIFEFSVTIFSPYWERLLFFGADKDELEKIRQLENRLLTKNDLQQFLELILASFCDLLQIENAGLFEQKRNGTEKLAAIGRPIALNEQESLLLIGSLPHAKNEQGYINIAEKYIFPISQDKENKPELLGFILCSNLQEDELDDEKIESMTRLLTRAGAALYDRQQQEAILDSLDILSPQVFALQNLLALSRFNRAKIIDGDSVTESDRFEGYIKDALSHFFGGPRLSQSPLIQLATVQARIVNESEPAVTALRAVLQQAIHRIRPNGDRQYTNEWVLFNILELKFIEGWKVRELCRKLSLSEADFYRKQRIAVAAVADQILFMEQELH